VPSANDGATGVTAIDTSVGCATARVAEPEMELDVAVTRVVPAARPEASPAPLMVATPGVEELHITELVIFFVLPSE
jgi:hypothetical protein